MVLELLAEEGGGAVARGGGRPPMGKHIVVFMLCNTGGCGHTLGRAPRGWGCQAAATEPLGVMRAGRLGAGDLERELAGWDGRHEGRLGGLGDLDGVGLGGLRERQNTLPSSAFIWLGTTTQYMKDGCREKLCAT